jgi:hypothetical protein
MNASRKPTADRPAITRRELLQSTMAAAAGLTILPSGVFGAANSPNNKLNVALIGAWGRARAHFNSLKGENVVALCDVDEQNLAKAAALFPGAKRYVDWRKCLGQKDVDAVVCSTTDQSHLVSGSSRRCEKENGSVRERPWRSVRGRQRQAGGGIRKPQADAA